MEPQAQHLQLVFLASTVTPAWGTGWVFTATPLQPSRPAGHYAAPIRLRLAVISA
ncbi:hypothetical protein [Hymenobacter negativus]|uniref:hypothetical protein n=1 Tax=Hymenobacter negativus TaxID=2795026 RepID=UPI0018DDAC70|nr:hypothetical protein [Hymenobacter negativus]